MIDPTVRELIAMLRADPQDQTVRAVLHDALLDRYGAAYERTIERMREYLTAYRFGIGRVRVDPTYIEWASRHAKRGNHRVAQENLEAAFVFDISARGNKLPPIPIDEVVVYVEERE